MSQKLYKFLIPLCLILGLLSACQTVTKIEDPSAKPDYTVISPQDLSQHSDYQNEIAALNPLYQVKSGDRLRIDIYGEPDLSGLYQIRQDGSITLPFIGSQQLKGKTLSTIEADLKTLYSGDYLIDPVIAVSLKETSPVYILGEIENPGRYDFSHDLKIINVVALAGGYTFRANKNKIELMRPHNGELKYFDPVPSDTPIMPGDIILIKERFF